MASLKELQDLVDVLKGQAGRRASDLLGEGRSEVRRAIGGQSDGTLLGIFGLGVLFGAIIGATLALLLVPFPGDVTRQRFGANIDKMRMREPAATNGSPPSSSVGSAPDVPS